jgi:hypothetical protein
MTYGIFKVFVTIKCRTYIDHPYPDNPNPFLTKADIIMIITTSRFASDAIIIAVLCVAMVAVYVLASPSS